MELKLTDSIASKADVTRLYRELDLYCTQEIQHKIRKDKNETTAVSDQLKDFAVQNSIDLSNKKDCDLLLKALSVFKEKLVVIHISFPVEPNLNCVSKLVIWFRQNVDPNIVVQIGLQPSIAAGIIVRTPSKQFDFSLRRHLYEQSNKLQQVLYSGV